MSVNSDNKICGACRQDPKFHRHAKQTTPSTVESINGESQHTKLQQMLVQCLPSWCLIGCTVRLTKSEYFQFTLKAITLETIPTISYESVTRCCEHASGMLPTRLQTSKAWKGDPCLILEQDINHLN